MYPMKLFRLSSTICNTRCGSSLLEENTYLKDRQILFTTIRVCAEQFLKLIYILNIRTCKKSFSAESSNVQRSTQQQSLLVSEEKSRR
ncbi:hypothetical protein X975_17099, partial [Stegodyphus mimosarum]